MNDLKALDQLGPIADEMLAGLHAGEGMKMRIREAAMEQPRARRKNTWVPAVCCAALALVCVGAVGSRLYAPDAATIGVIQGADGDGIVEISTMAAGEGARTQAAVLADLGEGASVRMAKSASGSLFASGSGDIPMVTVNGAVYRLLETPQDLGASLLGEKLGEIAHHTGEPSLASADELAAGVSNVAAQGAQVYAVSGMDAHTAVIAEVDGCSRLFQRVSYAGKGPGRQSLEDTFSVRGQVKSMELSGVGEISGDKANAVIAVLLDQAQLVSADATANKQQLTVTLQNGLRLQLGVSGDTLSGCGLWSCPEFFEAFEAAM